MSIWLLVRCRECGHKVQRLVDTKPPKPCEPVPMAFCSHCGRRALFVVSAEDIAPPKKRKDLTPVAEADWLRWACVDAGLDRS